LAGQRPRHQDGGVDRGKLAVGEALTGLHVQEMVVEALVPGDAARVRALRGVLEKAKRREHPLARRLAGDITALDTDRVDGQRKTDGGDTGERGRRIAIRHQTILGIGGVPEKPEGPLLQIDQERVDDRTRLAQSQSVESELRRFAAVNHRHDRGHLRYRRDETSPAPDGHRHFFAHYSMSRFCTVSKLLSNLGTLPARVPAATPDRLDPPAVG
jgi:hypothetical protein